MIRVKTPWYYGWNVVAIGIVFQAVIFGTTMFAFTMWVEPWMAEFNAERADIMLGFLALGLVQSVLAPFAGHFMDRVSIRVLVCAGAACAASGFFLISMATAFWQIAFLYGTLITIGVLLAGPLAAQTLAAKWFRSHRGLAIGLSTIGTSLGGFLLVPVVTYLYLELGWRSAHVIIAVATAAIILPLVWTFVRSTPDEAGIEPEPEADEATLLRRGGARTFPQWTTLSILKERNFWIMVLAFGPLVTAFGGLQQNLAPFASDHGISAQDASYLVSLMAGTMVGGKIFFGFMADHWDHRVLYWIAAAVLSATMTVMLVDPNYTTLLVASALLGVAAGGFLPLLGAITGSRFGPQAFGSVMGLLGPFLVISQAGPVLAGWIRDEYGTYDLALQIFLVIMVPAVVIMFFLKSLKPSRDTVPAAAPAPGE